MSPYRQPDRPPEPAPRAEIGPYPWQSLGSVPREAVGMLRDARRAALASVDLSGLGQALGEIVGCHVRVLVPHVQVVTEEPRPAGICVALGSSDGTIEVDVEVDRDLAITLVGAVVGHRAAPANPRAPVDAEIEGAVAAIVCSALRRAHGSTQSLGLLGPGSLRRAPGERLLRLCATVLIGNDAFSARVTVRKSPSAVAVLPPPREVLASLGDVALSVPVVAATAIVDPTEIAALAKGDVFLPAKGWTICRAGGDGGGLSGTVILATPTHDRGVLAKLGSSGELVVVGLTTSPLDTETTMGDPKADDGAICEAVLETPVIVRVELGAVTLTAREWAAIGPGDVVPLGKRVAEPAVLRIAGIEVAKGELVEIEGELGVRIRERTSTGAA
jgi:flagellar motor switch/type III secretory pathway protein FliN